MRKLWGRRRNKKRRLIIFMIEMEKVFNNIVKTFVQEDPMNGMLGQKEFKSTTSLKAAAAIAKRERAGVVEEIQGDNDTRKVILIPEE